MKLRDKIIAITISLAALIWFLHLISGILAPFICAIIIAYFLNPVANKLEKCKLSRSLAALIIVGSLLLGLVIGIIFLLPILYNQFLSLVISIPKYFDLFKKEIYPRIFSTLEPFGIKLDNDIGNYFDNKDLPKLLSLSNDIVGNVMQSGAAIINALSLVFITPILIFYLIKDWNLMIDKIDQFLPKKYKLSIRKIFKEIDLALSGYVKGQFNVCLILGILYAVSLSFAGLNFGFLIGFLTGIISFIPYLGMLIGATSAVIIGLFQWGPDLTNFSILAAIFLIVQIIESNFLTPKLVGRRIGLHPLWMIFGLFVFAAIFGFIGILFAIPMCAIAGVLAKFIGAKYIKNQNVT